MTTEETLQQKLDRLMLVLDPSQPLIDRRQPFLNPITNPKVGEAMGLRVQPAGAVDGVDSQFGVILRRHVNAQTQRAYWTKEHRGLFTKLTRIEFNMLKLLQEERVRYTVQATQIVATERSSTHLLVGDDTARRDEITMTDAGLDFAHWLFLLDNCNQRWSRHPLFFLSTVRAILDGMYPFHAANFVHCDFKLDNFCFQFKPCTAHADHYELELDLDKFNLIDFQFCLPPTDKVEVRTLEKKDYPKWQVVRPSNLYLFPRVGDYLSPNYLRAAKSFAGELVDKERSPIPRDNQALQSLDWRIDLFSLGVALDRWLKAYPLTSDPKLNPAILQLAKAMPTKFKAFDIEGTHPANKLPHKTLVAEIAALLDPLGSLKRWPLHVPKQLPPKQTVAASATEPDASLVFVAHGVIPSESGFDAILDDVDVNAKATGKSATTVLATGQTQVLPELLPEAPHAQPSVAHPPTLAQKSIAKRIFNFVANSFPSEMVLGAILIGMVYWQLTTVSPITFPWHKDERRDKPAIMAFFDIQNQAKSKITLDFPKTQWAIGETLQFKVTTDKAGYLTLFQIGVSDPDNQLSLLMPNTPVEAGTHDFPHELLKAQWQTHGPAGQSHLLVVVTPTPVDWASADGKTLKVLQFKSAADVKAFFACKQGNTSCDAEKSFANYAASSVQTLVIVEAPKTITPPVAVAAPVVTAAPSPQIIEGFEILDDPVLGKGSLAKDLKTGLVWQRCSVGQTWDGRSCVGEAKSFTFADVQKLAANGWRVPTIRELSSLIYCSSGQMGDLSLLNELSTAIPGGCLYEYSHPTIRTNAFPQTKNFQYWSSSRYAGSAGNAWLVDYKHGFVGHGSRRNDYHVRLMR